jgi:hypothetical protein
MKISCQNELKCLLLRWLMNMWLLATRSYIVTPFCILIYFFYEAIYLIYLFSWIIFKKNKSLYFLFFLNPYGWLNSLMDFFFLSLNVHWSGWLMHALSFFHFLIYLSFFNIWIEKLASAVWYALPRGRKSI